MGRLERKKAKTRQKIIDIAIPLFRQHGFDATTMEQIAEEADIAKGTLYNYFSSKEAIVNAFIQHTFKERSTKRFAQIQALPDTWSRMVMVFGELLQGVEAYREIFEKYLAYRIQKVVSVEPEESADSGLRRLGSAVITLGQEQGDIRRDMPTDMLQDLFEFAFIEVVKAFYMKPDFNAQQTIEQCVGLFMNGVGNAEST